MRLMTAACLLLALPGCASDGPSRNQDLTVSAPTASSFLYPGCHGRTVHVTARIRSFGSRVDALRVLVTGGDGAVHPEAPAVRAGGPGIQAITSEGGAAVIWFTSPGPCDGSCVAMTVTVPQSAPCPYRLRLVPVFRAP